MGDVLQIIEATPAEKALATVVETVESHKKTVSEALAKVESLDLMTIAVKEMTVKDDEEYKYWVQKRNVCADQRKLANSLWDRLAKASDALHKMITGNRGQQASAWESIEKTINGKLDQYLSKKEAAAKEAARIIQQEEERRRRELARESEDLLSKGMVKEASRLENQAGSFTMPAISASLPKVEGNRVIDKYEGKVIDPISLIVAVANGKFPLLHEVRGDMRPIITVDQVVVNEIVSRLQSMAKIPGVEVTSTKKSRPGRK